MTTPSAPDPRYLAALAGVDRRRASQLWRLSFMRVYSPGCVMLHQDESADTLAIVVAGTVRLTRSAGDSRVGLGVESAPVAIAGLGLLDHGPNFLTAIAETPVEAYTIERGQLLQLCYRCPDVLTWVLGFVCRSMRLIASSLDATALGSVRQRLARILVEMATHDGTTHVSLGSNQDEFAQRLGTVREVLFRNLKSMESQGLLHRDHHRREVTIDNLEGLKRVAGSSA